MAFNTDGSTRDYRFVEVNEAFVDQTGLDDATGKWMRDLAPDHEPYWFEIYGKVALTGEPVRFEQKATALDHRWYDVRCLPDRPRRAARQLAVLFNHITTVRRNAEQQQAMLNEELGHRMKNSMALVQAIASQTLRGAVDRVAVQAFDQRIGSAQPGPRRSAAAKLDVGQLADVVLGAIGAHTDPARVSCGGPEVSLEPKAALSLSLLLHELGTNAVKYRCAQRARRRHPGKFGAGKMARWCWTG